jgi:hypothetical protein
MNRLKLMSDGIGSTAFTYTQTGQVQSETGGRILILLPIGSGTLPEPAAKDACAT